MRKNGIVCPLFIALLFHIVSLHVVCNAQIAPTETKWRSHKVPENNSDPKELSVQLHIIQLLFLAEAALTWRTVQTLGPVSPGQKVMSRYSVQMQVKTSDALFYSTLLIRRIVCVTSAFFTLMHGCRGPQEQAWIKEVSLCGREYSSSCHIRLVSPSRRGLPRIIILTSMTGTPKQCLHKFGDGRWQW